MTLSLKSATSSQPSRTRDPSSAGWPLAGEDGVGVVVDHDAGSRPTASRSEPWSAASARSRSSVGRPPAIGPSGVRPQSNAGDQGAEMAAASEERQGERCVAAVHPGASVEGPRPSRPARSRMLAHHGQPAAAATSSSRPCPSRPMASFFIASLAMASLAIASFAIASFFMPSLASGVLLGTLPSNLWPCRPSSWRPAAKARDRARRQARWRAG